MYSRQLVSSRLGSSEREREREKGTVGLLQQLMAVRTDRPTHLGIGGALVPTASEPASISGSSGRSDVTSSPGYPPRRQTRSASPPCDETFSNSFNKRRRYHGVGSPCVSVRACVQRTTNTALIQKKGSPSRRCYPLKLFPLSCFYERT